MNQPSYQVKKIEIMEAWKVRNNKGKKEKVVTIVWSRDSVLSSPFCVVSCRKNESQAYLWNSYGCATHGEEEHILTHTNNSSSSNMLGSNSGFVRATIRFFSWVVVTSWLKKCLTKNWLWRRS